MKRVKAILMVLVMLVISVTQAAAYTAEDAYKEFKSTYPEFIGELNSQNISDDLIVRFLTDIQSYMKEVNSKEKVTEENFNRKAIDAISTVSAREEYIVLQDALILLYPNAIKQAVIYGEVSSEFVPLVNTIKSIVFGNNMLDDSSTQTGAESNQGNGYDIPYENEKESSLDFTDINSLHWAYEAVSYLADNFILNGYLDGAFRPENKITRAEFAKIVVSAMGKFDHNAQATFTDVNKESWYYPYVASAMKEGYIMGYPDGSFAPEANITRADICTIVYRCMEKASDKQMVAFSDDSLIPSYARDAVYALAGKGIINGMGDNTFCPLEFATRAQTAKIVYNAFFKEG